MIVISIVAVLSSVVLTALAVARTKARDTRRIGEIKTIEKALALYSISNNGKVPLSIYPDLASLPKINGMIDCNDPTLIANNNNLYDTLIAAKTLPSKLVQGLQANLGYCYFYVSDQNVLAGTSYDQDGNLISTGPLAAVITSKIKTAAFGSFLEATKTRSGYQALVAVTFGNPNDLTFAPNINLTTGVKIDVDYLASFNNGGAGY